MRTGQIERLPKIESAWWCLCLSTGQKSDGKKIYSGTPNFHLQGITSAPKFNKERGASATSFLQDNPIDYLTYLDQGTAGMECGFPFQALLHGQRLPRIPTDLVIPVSVFVIDLAGPYPIK